MGAVGVGHYGAGESAEGASEYADGVVDAEGLGGEFDAVVGLAEHEFEFVDLWVGDDGDGFVKAACFGGAVDHESVDVREGDDGAPFAFGAADEDDGGNDDSVYHSAASVAPEVHFLLDGDVVFDAFGCELFCDGFFVAWVDDGDEPFAGRYAYGAVNARGHCRYVVLYVIIAH